MRFSNQRIKAWTGIQDADKSVPRRSQAVNEVALLFTVTHDNTILEERTNETLGGLHMLRHRVAIGQVQGQVF